MSVDLESLFEQREQVRKPRWQKALPWLLAVAAVAAGIVFLVVKVGNTGESTATPLTDEPAVDVSGTPATVKLDPEAKRVARRFIQTAVARKNLGEAYALAGPAIRQGQTLAEWKTGAIAVVPYPINELEFAPMKVDFSYKNEAQIEVALLPRKGSSVRPTLFIASLIKNKQGKWLVNSWVPRVSPMVPNASANNGG